MDVNEQIHAAMPLCKTLGIVTRTWQPDLVEMELAWDERCAPPPALLHGGAVMALADSAGGACAAANLPEGAPARRRSSRRPTSSAPSRTA